MRARRECGSSLLPCVKVSDGFAKGFGFVTFLICTLDSRAACPSTRVILIFAGARFFLPTERRETRDERDRRTQRVCYSGCHFKLGFLAPYHTFNSALFSIKKMMSCIRAAASKSFQSTKQGARRWVHVEKRLEELGITLPKPSSPRANYNIVCRSSGNMMYISGHLPFKPDGTLMTGRIGEGDLDKDYGYQAARHAGLNIISTLKEQLGDLDRVEQVVKVFGIVQSTDEFKEQHLVMDGCSDVIMEVFGKPVGYHARSAIGTSTLPIDISVEVEAIVQIKPE